MRGRDGKEYSIEVEADSLFQAAYNAMQHWAKFWEFNPDSILKVEFGDQVHHVRYERVQKVMAPRKAESTGEPVFSDETPL